MKYIKTELNKCNYLNTPCFEDFLQPRDIGNKEKLDIEITNKSKIERIFKKYKNKFIFILHSSAQPSYYLAKNNIFKDLNINAIGSLNMLEFTKIYFTKVKFIFTSTNKVYGNNPNKLKFIDHKSRWEVEKKLSISVKKININAPIVGDHQWYISDISKFKKCYPDFKLKYNITRILDEIIEAEMAF